MLILMEHETDNLDTWFSSCFVISSHILKIFLWCFLVWMCLIINLSEYMLVNNVGYIDFYDQQEKLVCLLNWTSI